MCIEAGANSTLRHGPRLGDPQGCARPAFDVVRSTIPCGHPQMRMTSNNSQDSSCSHESGKYTNETRVCGKESQIYRFRTLDGFRVPYFLAFNRAAARGTQGFA